MLEIMKTWLRTQFHQMHSALCQRGHLALKHVALHYQITVLQRSVKRPRFSQADRLFWVGLSIMWSRWPDALKIIQDRGCS